MRNSPANQDNPAQDQRSYLIRSGDFSPEELADAHARVARGELADRQRATRQAPITASLTVPEIAAELGISVEEVIQLHAGGGIYGFRHNGELRFATWQLTGDPDQPKLPHVEQLIEAFPNEMHPASVLGFMTTPLPDARLDGRPATPVEWLLGGGDPAVLVEILETDRMW